jgi:diphosphomevalonate decarboxylase
MMRKATALAHPNIALVKYWGKRDLTYNLPAAGSVSMTLDGMSTRTTVRFDPELEQDRISLNGEELERGKSARLARFMDRVRIIAQSQEFAHVDTINDFPTSAGLASSASGFAALALAATKAAGVDLDPRKLSILARLGSGSAARSIYGGWAEMMPGVLADGTDCYARQIADESYWDLRCLVAVCAQGPKAIGSTEAMMQTARTAPYYEAWVADVPRHIQRAHDAIQARDFEALALIAEESCLRMHACAMAASPGILYWKGITVELIHHIRALRASGTPVFFTIDAGPHIKAFCTPDVEDRVAASLAEIDGVLDVLHTKPGAGARLI